MIKFPENDKEPVEGSPLREVFGNTVYVTNFCDAVVVVGSMVERLMRLQERVQKEPCDLIARLESQAIFKMLHQLKPQFDNPPIDIDGSWVAWAQDKIDNQLSDFIGSNMIEFYNTKYQDTVYPTEDAWSRLKIPGADLTGGAPCNE
jgi:hypothetical protein